jgi:hypothetical protein
MPKLSGSAKPAPRLNPPVIKPRPFLTIEFYSDDSGNIRVQSKSAGPLCDGVLDDELTRHRSKHGYD